MFPPPRRRERQGSYRSLRRHWISHFRCCSRNTNSTQKRITKSKYIFVFRIRTILQHSSTAEWHSPLPFALFLHLFMRFVLTQGSTSFALIILYILFFLKCMFVVCNTCVVCFFHVFSIEEVFYSTCIRWLVCCYQPGYIHITYPSSLHFLPPLGLHSQPLVWDRWINLDAWNWNGQGDFLQKVRMQSFNEFSIAHFVTLFTPSKLVLCVVTAIKSCLGGGFPQGFR